MKIITVTLLILATICVAHARPFTLWSYQELYDKADLVIIAKPISIQDTVEKTTLSDIPDVHVVGLSTEFKIRVVMKGDKSLKKATLHHYRIADPKEELINGPRLISFDPKQQLSTRFLLFLHLERDGRYSPVAGQTDPGISVLKLTGAAE
jgi:hypothetical protein